MAAGLYIGGTRAYAGKNTLTAGIGLQFQKEGLNIGYMKPIGVMPVEKDGHTADEDAAFVQEVLGLKQPADLVTPVLLTRDFKMSAFAGLVPDCLPKIAEAFRALARERDLMLVCGSGHALSGKYCRLDGIRLVQEMDLKAVVIDRLQHEINYDELLHVKELLGDRMLGAVLNDVPADFMNEIENVVRPCLERYGVQVLGVLPHDSLMSSIRAYELAEGLGGRLAAAQHRAGRMVENFLIGTMQVENFMTHFIRNPNAAVIVGGDRADVQLVAIEGGCPCLVLTGNLFPNDLILSRADAMNVPIVLVRQDTYTTAQKMEKLLTRHKLRDIGKIRRGAKLVASELDFDALRSGLGLGLGL
ncbi:MAG: AAA family ATPase [Desulfovibrio sp.]|jgi:BioD-like phosphotransacetylase family protein|nr:AAA family ATPase [Desulfovibrio sp.]